MKPRLYILVAVNARTGKRTPLPMRPETHAKACTIKSKFTIHAARHIELQEVTP